MGQEILNQIAEKEGYADWHELTEQNDPNTIYEYTLKALNQALSVANVVGRSEQFTPKQLYTLAQRHSIQDFQKILKEAPTWKG